ncbi:MAG: PQQ-like beta-propeller repeat protein, partial [Gemmataceae bacterium]|nr:PQQ-like beta-propeller repeat protein [Gemmataceae bacterium]
RIASLPVPLDGQRLAVADAAGGLTLVRVAGDGSLSKLRRYDLGGTATAGPFVRETAAGPRLAVVVDGTRLVWIDPAKKAESWRWPAAKGEALVGEPVMAEGKVALADQSGRYVLLDEATGKEVGQGHRLSGSVSPASGPVPFGKGRLLAPLSDGTLLLLPMEKLEKKD